MPMQMLTHIGEQPSMSLSHLASRSREVFPLIPAFSMAIMRSGYHAASILSMILT